MKLLIATATYNEVENVTPLCDQIHEQLPDATILIIDDHSPDGTGELLTEMQKSHSYLQVVHRTRKLGLGTAHKLAMLYCLKNGFDALITLDADFSHHPKYLPEMVRLLSSHDFVIGSRYTKGGKLDYPLSRKILSRGANTLARYLLSIPLAETTTSYRGFRRELLAAMPILSIQSEGYSFFVECIFRVSQTTKNVTEFPIHFEDRIAGISKISKKEIYRGMTTLLRLAVSNIARQKQLPVLPIPGALKCDQCQSEFLVPSATQKLCLVCGLRT